MKHRHKGKYLTRTKSGYYVYKRKPKHQHLSKENRSLFQNFDKKKYEVGGYMDFNKKGLERADVYIGNKASVDIEITPDKEVDYHTHPKGRDKRYNKIDSFPSKWDVKTFKDYPSQSMIVFHDGKAMVATKTDKFKVNNKKLNKVYTSIYKDANRMNTNKLYNKYKPEFEKMGLSMKYVKRNKPIKIPIDIVEPIHKPKLSKSSGLGDMLAEQQRRERINERIERIKDESEGQLTFDDLQRIELLEMERDI